MSGDIHRYLAEVPFGADAPYFVPVSMTHGSAVALCLEGTLHALAPGDHRNRDRISESHNRNQLSMNINIPLAVAILFIAVTAGPAPSAQTPRLKQVMRAKLDHSQKILEAVVTSNWQLLDRESRDIALVVRDPAWQALMMPEFTRHSEAFLRATDGLTEAARLRDLEYASCSG